MVYNRPWLRVCGSARRAGRLGDHMRKIWANAFWLCGTSLALAVPATAVDWSGYGQVSGGGGVYNATPLYNVPHVNPQWTMAGGAHINLNFDAGPDIQLDAEGARNFFAFALPTGWSGLGRNRRADTYGFGAHMDVHGENFRAGYLLSFGNTKWMSAGLEGALYLERVTLFSQFTYSTALSSHYPVEHPDYFYLHTGGRYFLLDNLMFELEAGAGVIDAVHAPLTSSSTITGISGGITQSVTITGISGGTNGNMLHWSAKAEYRLGWLPMSIGLDYQGSYENARFIQSDSFKFSPGGGYTCNLGRRSNRTENIVMLKLRYYFGQDTLLANDRNGAAMNDYNPLYGAEPVLATSSGVFWPTLTC